MLEIVLLYLGVFFCMQMIYEICVNMKVFMASGQFHFRGKRVWYPRLFRVYSKETKFDLDLRPGQIT